jgi:hypothetical protein
MLSWAVCSSVHPPVPRCQARRWSSELFAEPREPDVARAGPLRPAAPADLYRNFKPSGVLEPVTLVTVEIVCPLG